MKKLSPLILVLLMASSVLAQGLLPAPDPINTPGGMIEHGLLQPASVSVTDADNDKTITLHVGEELGVDLPNERHYDSGDAHYGLESVSTVSFDGLSNNGVLNMVTVNLRDGSAFQDDRDFVAASAGQTTLSYKRMTSYVSHGGCPMPMSVGLQTISFNIVVK